MIRMNNKTMEQKIDEIYNEVIHNDNMLDFFNIISIGFGIYNTLLNTKQIDNNTIMQELNRQDKIYFEQIIKMLEEIKGEKNEQCNDAKNDDR